MLDVSRLFYEYSVVTSELDHNYNLVYKFHIFLFTLLLSIVLPCQFARPRVLFISYVNIRMIEILL